jgi:hypothetical protein
MQMCKYAHLYVCTRMYSMDCTYLCENHLALCVWKSPKRLLHVNVLVFPHLLKTDSEENFTILKVIFALITSMQDPTLLRVLICQMFGVVNRWQNWKSWERRGQTLDYQ